MDLGKLLWTLLFMEALCPHMTNAVSRVYYVGIRDIEWNYAPKGRNAITNQPLDSDIVASNFIKSGKKRIGSTYKKTIYKGYKDDSFMDEMTQPSWLGFLGPVIWAEVGDVISVHLKNFATRPYTIHPHGVFYKKDSEGSLYPDGTSGQLKADDAVMPGGSHIYNWTVPEGHAPTDADPACLTWIYHSHVDAPRDIATGLIGPLVTCKRGTLNGNSPPRRQDIENDFFLLFSVIDENLSWHINENIATYCTGPCSVDIEDEDFQESNRMHAINGFIFGNLPELIMCAQKPVAWHLFGMGNEVDVHTAFFQGQMLTIRGHHTDVANLFPATFVTAEMVPQEPGIWLISCQVNSHLRDGMQALYKIKSCSMDPPMSLLTGRVREYFIQAHEIQWDYGPLGYDGSTGTNLRDPGSGSNKFFQKSSSRIGGKYWKVRYEAFKDETFQESLQLEEDNHLGILGPVIRAEVGDTIHVTFYNRASQTFSIQPHGVFYEKDNKGTIYNDGIFEIYCQAASHREAGMKAIYNVSQCPGHKSIPQQHYQAARTYYIMAEEILWDYCPDRKWELEWHNQSADSYSHVFLSNKDGLLGSKYKKAVFREYTDGSFRIPRPRTGSQEHLGLIGPLLKGEIGEILTVVFKNNASRPYSVHADGVLESSSGWPLAAVPGEVITYQWNIPERSGPGPNDSACVSWIYYSSVNPIKDMYTGLVGPLIICRKGTLDVYGERNDVDREFSLLFLIFDENKSWYLEENMATYGSQEPSSTNLQNATFLESNKMHAINGKLYANLKGLKMYQGERVAWYMLAMGEDIDIHTVHFHAESFIYKNGESYRADVVDLFPGTFEVVEMVASNPGTWLMHCHVADHVHAGMETLFTVLPKIEQLSSMITITESTGKAILRDLEEGNVNMLGMKIPLKNVEILAAILIAMDTVLLISIVALGGVFWYQHRKRQLRRNRRSILNDSFTLLSLKQ
ncbi:hephaestin isoform X5 [Suncus etruscus]|uniref:hephaestin isoform X5 n=1 Tax=Suncus etruscus TaxID=109475 RepID=UPI00211010FD|nr:hephaestin isoform X5 [Suncus etruscus]